MKKALFVGDRFSVHNVLIEELEKRKYHVDVTEDLKLDEDYDLLMVPQRDPTILNDEYKAFVNGFKRADEYRKAHPDSKTIVYAWGDDGTPMHKWYELVEQAMHEHPPSLYFAVLDHNLELLRWQFQTSLDGLLKQE